jgi:hypothetical protein
LRTSLLMGGDLSIRTRADELERFDRGSSRENFLRTGADTEQRTKVQRH